jgi:hypothetical protein
MSCALQVEAEGHPSGRVPPGYAAVQRIRSGMRTLETSPATSVARVHLQRMLGALSSVPGSPAVPSTSRGMPPTAISPCTTRTPSEDELIRLPADRWRSMCHPVRTSRGGRARTRMTHMGGGLLRLAR